LDTKPDENSCQQLKANSHTHAYFRPNVHGLHVATKKDENFQFQVKPSKLPIPSFLLSPEADRFYVTFPGRNEGLVKAGIKRPHKARQVVSPNEA
jgi:hypothetical protein